MKQVLVLTMMLCGGTVGALIHPFFGIIPYYVLSIVRPQYLWHYALPTDVRWSLIAAGVAMFGAVLHAPRLFAKLKWNPTATLMLILAGLILLSCITAHNPDVAAERGVEYFKIFVMALLATVVIQKTAHVRWLVWMIFACICYVAWEYNARYLFDRRLDILMHGHGGLDNNDVGVMIAMGLPLCYYWWQARPSIWTALGSAFAALVMAHALMLSYSRSGMVAGLVGLSWLALHPRPRRHLLVIAPLALVALSYMAGPEIRAEFFSIGSYKHDTTARMRLESWTRGWETAWDFPLTGAGVRNSNLMSEAYGAELNGRSIHNIYLQIAADSGIPAMIVFMAMLITGVFGLWSFRIHLDRRARIARMHGDGPTLDDDVAEHRALALSLEGAIISFAMGGMFLSLEFFELSWLVVAVAGTLPCVSHLAGYLERSVHKDRTPTAKPRAALAGGPAG